MYVCIYTVCVHVCMCLHTHNIIMYICIHAYVIRICVHMCAYMYITCVCLNAQVHSEVKGINRTQFTVECSEHLVCVQIWHRDVGVSMRAHNHHLFPVSTYYTSSIHCYQ